MGKLSFPDLIDGVLVLHYTTNRVGVLRRRYCSGSTWFVVEIRGELENLWGGVLKVVHPLEVLADV